MWGCTPTIVSTDSGVWSAGKLYANSSRDLAAVYDATVAAVNKLELKITDQAKDVFAARVVATGADRKIVAVEIKPGKNNSTDFTIHVGPLGNEERSRVIYEQIRNNLGVRSK